MTDWISVKDRLPEKMKRVLVYDDHEGICKGYRSEDYWSFEPCGDYALDSLLYRVTHWMPLPESPKETKSITPP